LLRRKKVRLRRNSQTYQCPDAFVARLVDRGERRIVVRGADEEGRLPAVLRLYRRRVA